MYRYASEASTLANKAGNMAKMSMAQGMGFVVGPIIGYAGEGERGEEKEGRV